MAESSSPPFIQPRELTLAEITKQPHLATFSIELPGQVPLTLRPLAPCDSPSLAHFLSALSAATRHLSSFEGYEPSNAQHMIEAIGRYSKLRLAIIAPPATIVGLMELNFSIPTGDLKRYAGYGIELHPDLDCRFGPTLSDHLQGQGIGPALFPKLSELARRLGQKRMILWGGVLKQNQRAISFYEKLGFRCVGCFIGPHAADSLDMMLELS